MSYWPPPPFAISVTISSDEPAYLALTWHPVCCWNGCTQSFSAYPSQAIRFNCPSPAPIDVGGFMPAVGGCAAAGPGLEVVPPQAAKSITSESPVTVCRAPARLLKRSPMSLPPPSRVGLLFRSFRLCRRNVKSLFGTPGQSHPAPAEIACPRRALRVLLHHEEPAAPVELHRVARHHAGIGDVLHPAVR